MYTAQSYNRNQIRLRGTDYEDLSVGAAAIGLTQAKVKQAWEGVVRVESMTIRYRVDGGDPTAGSGMPAFIGDVIPLNREEMESFKAIRVGASNADLRVQYYAA